jgi:hypothetical protein
MRRGLNIQANLLLLQKIKEYLTIHLTLSASAIADEKFYEELLNTRSSLQKKLIKINHP